jgi:hypothetical protein
MKPTNRHLTRELVSSCAPLRGLNHGLAHELSRAFVLRAEPPVPARTGAGS